MKTTGLFGKKRFWLAAAVLFAAVILTVYLFFRNRQQTGGKVVYVEKVSTFTEGTGFSNPYSGIVDSQDAWSVQQSAENPVKEILVTQGQEVVKGTPLLTYDIDKYQADLEQAEIDLARIHNELASARDTVKQLTAEKKKAPSADQANYTIQIQQQQLEVKQKELEAQSKQIGIDQLNQNIAGATLTSPMDGIVRSVGKIRNGESGQNEGQDMGDGNETALLTIVKTGDLRIKGTVNEQNIHMLQEGMEVDVHARNSDQVWKGTIEKIDRESKAKENNQGISYGNQGEENKSTNYPFYVKLENSEGLMIGQHVFITEASEGEKKDGLWLDEYLIDKSDESHPFVWVSEKDRLRKRQITLGAYDEELGKYEISKGLKASDLIAMPEEGMHEGQKTQNMASAGEEK